MVQISSQPLQNINISSEDIIFLMDQSKLLAILSAATSHNDFLNKLKDIMSSLSESDGVSSTSDHLNDNEDDCYGITYLEGEGWCVKVRSNYFSEKDKIILFFWR